MLYGYPAPKSPTVHPVVKRPLTEADQAVIIKYYRSLQNGLRGIAIFAIVLFVVNTFILPSIIEDWTVSFVFTLFMLMVGIVALGRSAFTLQVRRKIANRLREGSAIEVRGAAYKSSAIGGNRKAGLQGWNVGPITVLGTAEVNGMMHEGLDVNVLCIPETKTALSINDIGLKRAVHMSCASDLEALAFSEQPVQPATSKLFQQSPFTSSSSQYQQRPLQYPPSPQYRAQNGK